MRSWSYGATLGWAALAFLIGQVVALVAVIGWRPQLLHSFVSTPYDGVLITTFLFISNPITIAVLALAARLAPADVFDYLGLRWPPPRSLTIGIAGLVVLIAVSDALLYFTGQDLVTPFQTQSYSSAAAQGWLPAMLVATIIIAPAGEEVMFRGFLFRGWVRSDRVAWPAIAVISVLWAALHIQYDWAGVLQIFVVGLFLGWIRRRSGSTLSTFLLHALFNLEGTTETMLQMQFLS